MAGNFCSNFHFSKSFYIDNGRIKVISPLYSGQLSRKSHFLNYIKNTRQAKKKKRGASEHTLTKATIIHYLLLIGSVLDFGNIKMRH